MSVTRWRVLLEDGVVHEVTVVVPPGVGGGYIATYGDEDEGASAWEANPRAAVTAVAAGMHWAVRQVLGPGEVTTTEAWEDGAASTRAALATLLDERGEAAAAALVRAMGVAARPS